jgi:uncharacterized protein
MLLSFSQTVVYEWLGLEPGARSAAALEFFIYDSLKIFLLLAVMIFAIGVARTWLPEHKLKAWMGRGGVWGIIVAAVFGALTPFCSCSSIPIFITFLKAGVPLGAAFSFLVASPLINEYLVILMADAFGLKIAIAYVVSGLTIGVLAGVVIGRLRLERWLEADMVGEAAPLVNGGRPFTMGDRLRHGYDESASVLRKIWVWVLVGVGLGALIHNYVPTDTVHRLMEASGPFSVPIATLLGVPLYGSCAAIVPIALVLFNKGIPLGTALAFMMAMAALSLPEAVMLRRTMNLALIAVFFGVTIVGILFTGYLFNFLTGG